MLLRLLFLLLAPIIWLFPTEISAQNTVLSSSEIKQRLERLNVLGSVLYFAAHPDDENTRLIAWLAQEKKYRTAYLSLTRGEGGQNLIGTDLGIDLGLIRTQELLAARQIDKGEQFFSSAYDFGFSKTHQETFKFWDKEAILKEAVWMIRKLRPDVIITRFPPDKRGGHGHHQASAILAHEAFIAAADPNCFPEQLKTVQTWQATRLVWNTANFGGMNNTSEDQLKIDIGAYNPLLGQSYGEVAAKSRSQHKSQGFGAASTRGRQIEYFEHVAGKEAKTTLVDDVNTSWSRSGGTAEVQALVDKINLEFQPNHPEKTVDELFKLRDLVRDIDDPYWRIEKSNDINELILACAGIWIDATATQTQYPVNEPFQVNVEVIVRNPDIRVELFNINSQNIRQPLTTNELWKGKTELTISQTTQPYWLVEPHSPGKFNVPLKNVGFPTNLDGPQIPIAIGINGKSITMARRVHYRSVDPVRGEIYQQVAILPELTAAVSSDQVLSDNLSTKKIEVTFTKNTQNTKPIYRIDIEQPEGWTIYPQSFELDFGLKNKLSYTIELTPDSEKSRDATVQLRYNGKSLQSVKILAYEHIPTLIWFPTVSINCRNLQLINSVKKVGYIDGAGDLIPQSLANIGIEVSTLSKSQIDAEYLKQFDAVIVGVRYFNVNEKSEATLSQLLKYAERGGVVLVQYNVNSRLQSDRLGPYPFTLSRNRVTEEDAAVQFDKNDPALNYPNKITSSDFEGWVQERGLYFATGIDAAYRTPIRMNDSDEPSHNGSLLVAKHGKGKFVYTSLSFFRQLPAGVPGAYRLFLNLLHKEQ